MISAKRTTTSSNQDVNADTGARGDELAVEAVALTLDTDDDAMMTGVLMNALECMGSIPCAFSATLAYDIMSISSTAWTRSGFAAIVEVDVELSLLPPLLLLLVIVELLFVVEELSEEEDDEAAAAALGSTSFLGYSDGCSPRTAHKRFNRSSGVPPIFKPRDLSSSRI